MAEGVAVGSYMNIFPQNPFFLPFLGNYKLFFVSLHRKCVHNMLIGLNREKKELLEAYEAEESRFVAVYGRRRVGKTYLIRQTFKGKLTFSHSGQAKGTMAEQLYGWRSSLSDAGYKADRSPKSWLEAFDMLKDFIRQSSLEKKVIFIDELPWLDTPKSKFVNALEFFWNGWASGRDDVLLIVCGSATSWIINKLFKNHGGLHNRVTNRIYLQPFTLNECQQYILQRGISLSLYDIIECYMVMGGVPFYWSFLERGKSLAQNIDDLFFSPYGKLYNEFEELYRSLFHHPDNYISIVKTLGEATGGMTREEIISKCHITSSGTLTTILEDLENCGFIRNTPSYGLKNQGVYRLIDNFTLFYQKFMRENKNNDEKLWSHSYLSSKHKAWVGLAFERVCFQHIRQIKQALGISGVVTTICSWRTGPSEPGAGDGAQIDMLIDRADNMVNICEMKFSDEKYTLSLDDHEKIANRSNRFAKSIGYKKSVNIVMVTVFGITKKGYWSDVHNIITAEDLLKE